jgi:MFS superfamily sulfate permease-like transporter
MMQITPKTGWEGLKENWQSDLLAALSVALVALPLALGIAIASEAPPMAGILAAIIGGVVTTFIRGSHIAINGPTAGLIAAILSSAAALNDGTGQTLNYVFAAITVAGGIQVLLGALKLGRLAEIFHTTVIRGILAAIGIIIIAKQIHVALGTKTQETNILQILLDAFRQLPDANPFVVVISGAGLIILIIHSKITSGFFKLLPAPMWVLIAALPFVYAFNFFETHIMSFMGKQYVVGPHLLIKIPDNPLDAIMFPNFSKIGTWPFWLSVISITMIASIESLAACKAIDKLDPYKRKTNLNKDLVGIGLSTMLSGMLGGLPIITVIVRSTVNIQNHAKTQWANFYHGLLLLLFIFILAPFIQRIPLAALAALLVYIGYRLTSPKVFGYVYHQGFEQLVFFVGTLIITLFNNLLIGVFGGLALVLIAHLFIAKVSIPHFFRLIFKSKYTLTKLNNNGYELELDGIANFLTTIRLAKLLEQVPAGARLNVSPGSARLIDMDIMEHLYDFQRLHAATGGKVTFSGLESYISTSNDKLALKLLKDPEPELSPRQLRLKALAIENGYEFQPEPKESLDYLETFYFFKSRPVKAKHNRISGSAGQLDWEIADIEFEEGGFSTFKEYITTVDMILFPFPIPKFTIEKKALMEKVIDISKRKDIDYVLYENFTSEYVVKVEDKAAMSSFMSTELEELIKNSNIHHLESNGESILIFNNELRKARKREFDQLVNFSQKLMKIMEPTV